MRQAIHEILMGRRPRTIHEPDSSTRCAHRTHSGLRGYEPRSSRHACHARRSPRPCNYCFVRSWYAQGDGLQCAVTHQPVRTRPRTRAAGARQAPSSCTCQLHSYMTDGPIYHMPIVLDKIETPLPFPMFSFVSSILFGFVLGLT